MVLPKKEFLSGVIEGFYGRPWSTDERAELFSWMHAWGLNTYLYAPKDDLHHRALWREVYSAEQAKRMQELVRQCSDRNLRFIYALAPGLDIRFSEEGESGRIRARFEQMLELGCNDFALLFDDLPDVMRPADAARFSSFASAQAHVTNAAFQWLRQRSPQARFLFCPTPYCGRMALRQLGGPNYLEVIGRELTKEIDVFWTGPEIVSETIPTESLPTELLQRKPVIWDNLHANDYDRSRFYCGPYAGRAPEIKGRVNGILSNPNNEFLLNYIPLRTLSTFLNTSGSWDERAAFLAALREWFPRFETISQPVIFEQLLLFADCFYLPHHNGAAAEEFLGYVREMVGQGNREHLAALRLATGRLRDFAQKVTELRDRGLFYALSQRVWDLREEVDLLTRYVESLIASGSSGDPFTSDFHLPRTYRGGFVRQLQTFLLQGADGTFQAAATEK